MNPTVVRGGFLVFIRVPGFCPNCKRSGSGLHFRTSLIPLRGDAIGQVSSAFRNSRTASRLQS